MKRTGGSKLVPLDGDAIRTNAISWTGSRCFLSKLRDRSGVVSERERIVRSHSSLMCCVSTRSGIDSSHLKHLKAIIFKKILRGCEDLFLLTAEVVTIPRSRDPSPSSL